MKKSLLAVLVAVIALAVLGGCSKGYESQKTAGDLKITLKADRYPLIKGDNSLSVALSDAAGKAVTDASVQAKYYMPPMAGMAPMDFTAQTVSQGGRYSFSANIPMEGGWKLDVTATQPGKAPVTTTFNVDAR